MNKSGVAARIKALEEKKALRNSRKMDLAFDRLWRVLDAGLCLDLPPIHSGGFARCEVPLLALDARLTAATTTQSDRDLLARLPAAELAVWAGGVTARDFVGAFSKVFRDF